MNMERTKHPDQSAKNPEQNAKTPAKKKREPWIKPRHRVARNLAYALLYPYSKWKYGITVDRFREQGSRPWLILFNHQTPFDQFFVGMSFRGPVYYLSTEDLYSNGWISRVIRWLVAPIPIMKAASDFAAVKTCVRVTREGGTIGIAPEGNRTYSGRTEYMSPAIVKLVRLLKLPVALYRIEGGYGVQPRWSDGVRRGKMHSYVSRVIEPEEYETMDNDQLFAAIREGLTVDESRSGGRFRSRKKAEYLERAVYWCPCCGFSAFESGGNEIECKSCHRKIAYGEDKRLTGLGFDFPYATVAEWYDAQSRAVRSLDPAELTAEPVFRDRSRLSEVIPSVRKIPLREDAELRLYGDRIAVDEEGPEPLLLPFDEVTAMAALGRNKLNVYHGGKIWQFKPGKRFNALKYVNFYYHYKNVKEGDPNGEFLGL